MRVPVLSEAITVAPPTVSTAARRRTLPPRQPSHGRLERARSSRWRRALLERPPRRRRRRGLPRGDHAGASQREHDRHRDASQDHRPGKPPETTLQGRQRRLCLRGQARNRADLGVGAGYGHERARPAPRSAGAREDHRRRSARAVSRPTAAALLSREGLARRGRFVELEALGVDQAAVGDGLDPLRARGSGRPARLLRAGISRSRPSRTTAAVLWTALRKMR